MSDDLSIDNLKSDSAAATILAAEQASVDAYADNVDALASESILTSAENGWTLITQEQVPLPPDAANHASYSRIR